MPYRDHMITACARSRLCWTFRGCIQSWRPTTRRLAAPALRPNERLHVQLGPATQGEPNAAAFARRGCTVCHFQIAEVAVPRELFQEILRRIDGLRPRSAQRSDWSGCVITTEGVYLNARSPDWTPFGTAGTFQSSSGECRIISIRLKIKNSEVVDRPPPPQPGSDRIAVVVAPPKLDGAEIAGAADGLNHQGI